MATVYVMNRNIYRERESGKKRERIKVKKRKRKKNNSINYQFCYNFPLLQKDHEALVTPR